MSQIRIHGSPTSYRPGRRCHGAIRNRLQRMEPAHLQPIHSQRRTRRHLLLHKDPRDTKIGQSSIPDVLHNRYTSHPMITPNSWLTQPSATRGHMVISWLIPRYTGQSRPKDPIRSSECNLCGWKGSYGGGPRKAVPDHRGIFGIGCVESKQKHPLLAQRVWCSSISCL